MSRVAARDCNPPPPSSLLIRLPLFTLRLAALLILVLAGLFCIACVYPLVSRRVRSAIGSAWARVLLRICGMRLVIRGQAPLQSAGLWVANHVSWLDIFVLNSVRQTAFVAKQELRRWPILGWLIAGAGTVFVDRSQRHAVKHAFDAMQARFARHEVLGLFPEGTTSPGQSVLPFYASLLEPALKSGVPVQAVALLYTHHGTRSPLAAYAGKDTLLSNLWRVLGTTGLAVEAVFLEPVHTDAPGMTRHQLSATLHEQLVRVVDKAT